MKPSEHNDVPFDLISRYLSGEASPDEIIDFEKWRSYSTQNQKIFTQYQNLWERTGQLSLFADIDIENEWEVFLTHIEEEQKPRIISLRTAFIRTAAAILIGLVLSFSAYYLYNALAFTTVVAKGDVTEVELPDGSLATLNRTSEISFPKNFRKGRKVELDGEAFFEVTPDPERPFEVNSGDFGLEVLGTSFNLEAYESKNIVKVVVATGRVVVFDLGNPEQKDFLKAGEKIVYSRETGNRLLTLNKDPNYNAWKTLELRFEDKSLSEVVEVLKKVYDCEIEIKNAKAGICRISVNFTQMPVEEVLEVITKTLNLYFEKQDEKYLIYGEGC